MKKSQKMLVARKTKSTNFLVAKKDKKHIQNPKINIKNFDFVISPNHDNLNGKNVINSVGALHHLTDIKIKNSNTKYMAIAVNIKSSHSKSHLDLLVLIDNLKKKELIATNKSKKEAYVEIYGDKNTIDKFTIKTTQLLSEKEWNNAKIKSGLVDINRKTSELYTPHMLNLDLIGAISFDKGCYTGQEIVARTENLGRVKRRVNRYKLSTDKAKIGDELTLNNNKIGKIINVAKNNILAVTNVDNHQDVLEYKTYFAKPIELNY